MLFLKDLIIATTFQKLVKNSNFLLEMKTFHNFHRMFPTIFKFRPTERKICTEFLKFFENRYNNAFYYFSNENLLQNFKNSPASGGSGRPRETSKFFESME